MPLAFESVSHGTVAFGFFNIETDMLLLENRFFFATDFCRTMTQLACRHDNDAYATSWPGFVIQDPERVGDLMGAIHGFRHTGFIGDLYRKYPFPKDPAAFRQNPDGHRTRETVAQIIASYAVTRQITLNYDDLDREIAIEKFRFNRTEFYRLLRYVWRGGYPRWRGEKRPGYVMEMKQQIGQSRSGMFQSIQF